MHSWTTFLLLAQFAFQGVISGGGLKEHQIPIQRMHTIKLISLVVRVSVDGPAVLVSATMKKTMKRTFITEEGKVVEYGGLVQYQKASPNSNVLKSRWVIENSDLDATLFAIEYQPSVEPKIPVFYVPQAPTGLQMIKIACMYSTPLIFSIHRKRYRRFYTRKFCKNDID
jgi:hypothetical protein